jgi:hypothetical protein
LAIIANGGRAIVVIYTEGEEIHYFLLYFIEGKLLENPHKKKQFISGPKQR